MKRLFKLLLRLAVITVILVTAFTVLVVAAVLVRGSSKSVATPVAACQPDATALLSYVNTERAKLGAPSLTVDSVLATSAKTKLNDEVTNQYYGHNLVDGSNDVSILRSAGVRAASSEDLDVNAMTASAAWAAFKNSPTHYASLTNPLYTRVGIAMECVNYKVAAETDSSGNAPVGTPITEQTVVHLAAPEPVVQQAPQVRYVAPKVQTTTCYPAFDGSPATCYTR